MTFFVGSDYRWYLYVRTYNSTPPIEFNPSSVSASGGFYRITGVTYHRNAFFGDRNILNYQASELRSSGVKLFLAIGKTGKCWSVVKN